MDNFKDLEIAKAARKKLEEMHPKNQEQAEQLIAAIEKTDALILEIQTELNEQVEGLYQMGDHDIEFYNNLR